MISCASAGPAGQRPRTSGLALAAACLALVAVACGGSGLEGAPWELSSPDGRLVLTVAPAGDAAGGEAMAGLVYRLEREGTVLLQDSPLGIRTDRGDFVGDLRLVAVERRPVAEQYTMTAGKRRARQVAGRELTLTVAGAGGAELELVFRAHDDGIAYRYRLLGSGPVTVRGEASGFAVPPGGEAWMAPFDLAGVLFFATYEQLPQRVAVGTATESSGWAYPALFEVAGGEAWLLISESDLDAGYCATRLGPEPDGGLYPVRLPVEQEGDPAAPVEPSAELPLATPWRVVVAGTLATVVESTLVDDLARPGPAEPPAWIAPGRVAWSWFTQGTGDAALQAEYIDFAAELGWEYVLIDAGWDSWPEADETVAALAAQAAAAGVELLLWYNSGGEHTPNPASPRDRMLDGAVRRAEMAWLQRTGIAGIKVDFFESDKQARIAQYLGILRDAAEHELLVNFHGATLPRGWQRTHPHLMSHEAVRGAEYFRVLESAPRPDAAAHLFDVFARNPVGSMDYTPVVFEDALRESELPYAHSLAQAVLFESGLQHFADRADARPDAGYRALFAEHPFVRELLAAVPVAWDETRLLDGDPRSHAVLARRRGSDWWLAAIAGAQAAVTSEVELDFLGAGTYALELVTGGADPRQLLRDQRDVTAADSLELELPARGGALARLLPAP